MRASILIVSKNRINDLAKTLVSLDLSIDRTQIEVLVFLDGCTDNSRDLIEIFFWVRFVVSEKSIGASAARHRIYPLANSEILIGLDDDAHPLTDNFITIIENLFDENPNTGILAFEEVKGIYSSTEDALKHSAPELSQYCCSEFIGCGFAMRKSVYSLTDGFPVWIDIYGEESCLSIEVLDKGFDILFTNRIKVNHRVDRAKRVFSEHNYFRFGKQLKNSTYYFIVYFPNPIYRISKLYWHNFNKYALKDWRYFKVFVQTFFYVSFNFPRILKYRKIIDKSTLKRISSLSKLKY